MQQYKYNLLLVRRFRFTPISQSTFHENKLSNQKTVAANL